MPDALPATAATAADLRLAIQHARARNLNVGLVPTMGALHEGHVRLVEECKREADFVVVSIFVNPTQFGPAEDYSRYPRTMAADLDACRRGGASLVFAPAVEAMYPTGTLGTYVEVPGLADILEGASRPGHFRGVATVVLKLLNLVGPDVAHFGEKDYQQLALIRRAVIDLDVPTRIVGVETVREPDGLAMSSRNRYLDGPHRAAATVLSRSLGLAREAVRGGETSADRVRQILRSAVESEHLASLDYAEVADAATLEPLATLQAGRPARALLAARVGPTRLIDNAPLGL